MEREVEGREMEREVEWRERLRGERLSGERG